ncbi:hypothetical protein ACLOJK_007038 [Asimina triloba]
MKEVSLPRVATVIDVDLRPRRIWDGLDAAIMMDDLDGPTGCSPSVGFASDVAAFVFSVVGGFSGVVDDNSCWLWLRLAVVSIVRGLIHRSDPTLEVAAAFNVDGGAPYRCSMGVTHPDPDRYELQDPEDLAETGILLSVNSAPDQETVILFRLTAFHVEQDSCRKLQRFYCDQQ